MREICDVIGTALIWIGLWFLIDVWFKRLSVKLQIFGYLFVLVLGIYLLKLSGCMSSIYPPVAGDSPAD